MTRWALLLRGVNVGGVKVTSARLKEALEGAGFGRVRTVLASGNALVDSEGDAAAQRRRAEAVLAQEFEREIGVVVESQSRMREIAAACPFPSDSTSHHAYVIFATDDEGIARIATAMQAVTPGEDESLSLGPGVIYWNCPRGSSLETPLSKSTRKVDGSVLSTTRNLRTVLRLTKD